MPDRQEQWAVFWCSLLGPLLYGEVPPEEAGRFLNQLAASEHVFPDGQRRRPSRATVWRKWKQYRDGGFEALFRQRRSDRAVPTHLSAFIDCHSRYVVEARYYLRENLDILIDSLLRAWSAHGASRELYLDNAKIYHANALKAACFALNMRLLHRGVGDPPPGGLIERFFGTAQGQLESEVRADEVLTLDRLNQALSPAPAEWENRPC
jgi:transposase InsO family protein